jgi:hypothetical protein
MYGELETLVEDVFKLEWPGINNDDLKNKY